MELTGSFKIPKINLGFDYNNFIMAKIIYNLSQVKKIFITLLDLITIINKWEMSVIQYSSNQSKIIRFRQDLDLGFDIFFFGKDANIL